jgi:signal transduction histidine kinase/ActR/RegA family two-component response regulator
LTPSASPPPSPASRAFEAAADIDERARIDASLEVERRSIFTTVVIVLIAGLFTLTDDPSAGFPPVFHYAFAVIASIAALRLCLFRSARSLPPGSGRRLVWMFTPLLAQVAAWAAFATWGCIAAPGTGLITVIVATQCLCSAAVVMSYAGMPRLGVAIIVVTIVPPAIGTIAVVSGLDRVTGLGALLYCAMLVSYVPRVARERRAAVASMLLLAERARSLEDARDAALAAAAAREAFFANLSHEIRTPLHGLLGTVERLKGTGLDETQRVAVEQLNRCGRRLLSTLNEALDSTRLESGKLQLYPERMDLPGLLREVVDLFVDEARRKGLTLSLEMEVADHVIGDAPRLRQIFQNLVGNAVKFTDEGTVTLRARTTPSGGPERLELAVEVVDSGVGFDARDRARLFQRFSQLSVGKLIGGSGLGLSISAELVRLMDGTIDASSDGAGRGASFRVKIPLRAHSGASATIAGRRVLVVDDNPVNLAVACAYLEVLGVTVDAAAGGHEALFRSASVRYDAILMDCNMPDKDGFDTTRALRARGDQTPILAITAATDVSTRERCEAAGMQALVEKPISSDTLREALARVIAHQSS